MGIGLFLSFPRATIVLASLSFHLFMNCFYSHPHTFPGAFNRTWSVFFLYLKASQPALLLSASMRLIEHSLGLCHRYQCSYLVYNLTSCMSSALPRVPQSFFLLHPSLVTFGLEDHSESFIVRDVGNQTCARIISCLVSIPISIGSGEDLVCSSSISKPLIMQLYCARSSNVISFDGGSWTLLEFGPHRRYLISLLWPAMVRYEHPFFLCTQATIYPARLLDTGILLWLEPLWLFSVLFFGAIT